MRQKIRLGNDTSKRISIILEPLGEQRFLDPTEQASLFIDVVRESDHVKDLVEIKYTDTGVVIWSSPAAEIDWD